ncbi:MoxR family ATPase [Algiphilus sp. W345]|uniref:MoxR family ATPase n=1 Tax=Banduia mediterranea TaxID=3075609 RepID=A0ABU2WEV6_9GAMM|nr:MoxR family ATPase [Algiphilus sp. W345]MDT0496154.1 MoxR family ATPase [Algiphilus sp. W345]
MHAPHYTAPETLASGLAECQYVASSRIATATYLGLHLEKPLLVEGPAGVGKTELAKALAQLLDVPLVRLQCYEGLDEAKALYEWKYSKQLLYTQILRDKLGELMQGAATLVQAMDRLHAHDDLFYSEAFLEPRPLLRALREPRGCVLLVDEIDKADPEFEAFLLEVLSDYQISVPELGTLAATVRPLVLLTSNGARELSDALRRRCLHLYIGYPEPALERRILRSRVPELPERLGHRLVAFVQALRELDLKKLPAVSETLDWARTLVLLNADELGEDLVRDTLAALLKHEEDVVSAGAALPRILAATREAGGRAAHA